MGQRRQAAENGGIADEHVEPAEALIQSGSKRIDSLAVGEIEWNERSFAALGSNPIVDLFQSFPCTRDEQDMSTFADEGKRHGPADTTRSASDKRDPVLEA